MSYFFRQLDTPKTQQQGCLKNRAQTAFHQLEAEVAEIPGCVLASTKTEVRSVGKFREMDFFRTFKKYRKGMERLRIKGELGGGFKYLLFSPLFGEDFNFD